MDVAYVNPFISSTVDTFKTMMRIEVSAQKPQLKQGTNPLYDISGIIGLSGNAMGSISLSFPKVVALKTVSAMLGADIKIVGPELTDGIGEIVNIIAGHAKRNLTQYNLTISLPNVIVGKDHIVAGPTGTPTVVVPFASTVGNFAMEVMLKTAKSA